MKRKCIFVIGPEGSGSTLIAQMVSTALNGSIEWNGRGFNCCNSGHCDSNNDYVLPCRDTKHLVCHRSLPFYKNSKWPPIEKWRSIYDSYFIICTRDITISKKSVARRFGRKPETMSEHLNIARNLINEILRSEEKCFIWSYETFMYLKKDYFRTLIEFLKLESDYFPDNIKDANAKYINHLA